MRKAKLSLLAAVLFAGMAGTTLAADRAGIGLNWAIGPTIQLGDPVLLTTDYFTDLLCTVEAIPQLPYLAGPMTLTAVSTS